MQGELNLDNVKSFDVYKDDDRTEITILLFVDGELSVTIELTEEQRTLLKDSLRV
jgi:hypothetical protein